MPIPLPPLHRLVLIASVVDNNAIKPAFERSISAKSLQLSKKREEDVLSGLFRHLRIPHITVTHGVGDMLVSTDQGLKGRIIATSPPLDQCFIARPKVSGIRGRRQIARDSSETNEEPNQSAHPMTRAHCATTHFQPPRTARQGINAGPTNVPPPERTTEGTEPNMDHPGFDHRDTIVRFLFPVYFREERHAA